MNTYYISLSSNIFVVVNADSYSVEKDCVYLLLDHHVIFTAYESSVFSIEQLNNDYTISVLWTGEKYKKYQKKKRKA